MYYPSFACIPASYMSNGIILSKIMKFSIKKEYDDCLAVNLKAVIRIKYRIKLLKNKKIDCNAMGIFYFSQIACKTGSHPPEPTCEHHLPITGTHPPLF